MEKLQDQGNEMEIIVTEELLNVTEIREEFSTVTVNQLLQNGWKLIHIGVVFHVGEKNGAMYIKSYTLAKINS